jgi:hypothetical protein
VPSTFPPSGSPGNAPSPPGAFPSRYTNLQAARARFGDRVDRLGPYLRRSDSLADRVVETIEGMPRGMGWKMFERATRQGIATVAEAPDSFRALFAQAERVPVWVDWETLDRGGEVLLRAGAVGGLVLGLKSLILGYTTPAGNKPLIFSGRLSEQAPRRIHETARFVQATLAPRGMHPHADGYCITLKVRLIHAQVRRMIVRSGRWDFEAWGEPINQHDLVGTALLFSLVVLEGLRQLGAHITPQESHAYMHLWRYSSHLMGVDPDLMPGTEGEARVLGDLFAATEAEPDADSRRLTRALLQSPMVVAKTAQEKRKAARVMRFSAAVCRELIGTELADKLGVPSSPWSLAVPLVRRLVSGMESIRESVPFAGGPALRVGAKYWDRVVEVGLAGATAEFALPQTLISAA